MQGVQSAGIWKVVDTGVVRLDFYDNAEIDGDSITVMLFLTALLQNLHKWLMGRLVTKTYHGIFLFSGCDTDLVTFFSILHDHQGGVGRNPSQVFSNHYEYMFRCVLVHFERISDGACR